MIKLHGFPVSNYTNMVELALLEKGLPYEYVLTMPDQSAAFLQKSPRGKVPFVTTPQGCLSETSVILDYLEDLGEGKPLLPADPYERARVRALMKQIELYVELPARACFAEAFFGGRLPDAIKQKAREDLVAGFATLGRQASFTPYVAGAQFTLADVLFVYSVDLARAVAGTLFKVDPLAQMPDAADLLQRLNAMPNVQAIAQRRDAAMPAFIAAARQRFQQAAPAP
jgi:glutathione S-transferase